MISILCPTRNRPNEFRRMYDSIAATASGNIVEIVAYVDEDDVLSPPLLASIGVRYKVGPRWTLSRLWNECLSLTVGEIFLQGNDDIIFRTKNWDRMVEQAFAECEDKILMVHGNDGAAQGDRFGPHPFVHRRWVEALGYITPPWFSSDYGDTWINDLANALGRRKYLPFVVEHMHFLFGKALVDKTTADRLERHSADRPEQLYCSPAMVARRAEDVEKLRALMKKGVAA